MGILEEIKEKTEENNGIISDFMREVSAIKQELNAIKEIISEINHDEDTIIMTFKENDLMTFHVAAKYLKLKQRELEEIIKKGIIRTTGTRKRNFIAKDVFDFCQSQKYKSMKAAPNNLKRVV